jgi:hypothetical protein
MRPTQFDRSLVCREGELRQYVATVIDVDLAQNPPDGGFDGLPSAPPTDCHEGVAFGRVIDGREYIAEIDAYDRDDLRPRSAGSRRMIDSDGETVPPRWTATCGVDLSEGFLRDGGVRTPAFIDGSAELTEPAATGGPAVAQLEVTVPLIGCTAFLATGS